MIVFPAFCKPFVCKATKIVKGERRGKRKTKFFKFDSSEPRPSLWKDTERRMQYKKEACLFFIVGPHSGFGEIVKGFRVVIS